MAETSEKESPRYPGWGLDLRWRNQLHIYPTGIHYNCYGAQSKMLLVREVAMMLVMDRLMDKPDWQTKVFDREIAEKWKAEAAAWPDEDLWARIANLDLTDDPEWLPKMPKNILDRECADFCIEELRHKAEYFKRTGIMPTLDANFSIAKSDTLVSAELRSALREAFATLKAEQSSHPDWHPNTNETVQDLVHPSMYPLVYGRSLFHPEEVVGVEDAVDKYAGTGSIIPKKPEWGEDPADRSRYALRDQWTNELSIGGLGIHPSYWSTMYQWLPANVKFKPEGGVKFTSYINNLHPTKHRGIYNTIEKLIEAALPMWDQCLVQYRDYVLTGAGRHQPRLQPENPDDHNDDNWDPKTLDEMLVREGTLKEGQKLPRDKYGLLTTEDGDDAYERWREMREPTQPDLPSFDNIKVGYDVDKDWRLCEQFKERGLQLIVKMASIELTPEKPEFSPGGWHVEGQMNEHIIGTALYYLDSENITDSHLDFRTLTDSYNDDDYEIGQDSYHWMQSAFGTRLGSGSGSPCLQHYGSVMTPQGRLLAFPNVFQHRVSGFKLADPTKPGHRRFIALWLVDPFTRIINTGNVPPQQADWWADRAFGALQREKDDGGSAGVPPEILQLVAERGLGGDQLAEALSATAEAKAGELKLPPELLNMIRKELGDDGNGLPMTRKEAEEHRLALMQMRTAFQVEAEENWRMPEYSFCEH